MSSTKDEQQFHCLIRLSSLNNHFNIENVANNLQIAQLILRAVLVNETDKVSNFQCGITTDEIDKFVHSESIKQGAYPSPLNYNRFPKSVCTSVNNVACHGIPDDRPLQDGDIINVDVTVRAAAHYYSAINAETHA